MWLPRVVMVNIMALYLSPAAALEVSPPASLPGPYYGEGFLQGTTPEAKAVPPAISPYRLQLHYSVLETRPHSRHSFTQGLIVDGDELIESSGLYGKSFVQRYRIDGSGGERVQRLSRRLFAEGIALVNDKLYVLTWRNGQALVLNPRTLATQQILRYRGEGWGLATWPVSDGPTQLVMSDGSAQLRFRDPETFDMVRTLTVTDQGQPLQNLNDLAVARGLIWANVWYSTAIVAIDPHTGEVVGKIDLAAQAAAQPKNDPDNVLNGIAWDEQRQAFWVTGKRWNQRYLIQVEATPVKVETHPATIPGP